MLLLVFFLCASSAFSQAVTEGRTKGGLPWAVVELPGGDGEWAAAWVSSQVEVPAGWSEVEGAGEKLVTAWFPAFSAPAQLPSALAALPSAVAVVVVGPVPARELAAALEALEAVVPAPPLRVVCSWADGVVTPVRRTSEGFRWSFPLPPPWDPKNELAPALAVLAERRFQRLGFSGPVSVENGACPRLVLQHLGPNPRKMLAVARENRRKLAKTLEEEELSNFTAMQRREARRWAVDPRGVAVAGVERLGWGRALGPLLYPAEPAPTAVEDLLVEVFLRHAGTAEVWEGERRTLPPEVRTLGSGVVLAFRENASDIGILAVAFSGVDVVLAQALANELGVRAAKRGLPSQMSVGLGMAAVSLVGLPEELVQALEDLAELVAKGPGEGADATALAYARQSLGLATQAFAENVGVVLELPEGRDELAEAAEKFLAGLPAGKVAQLRQLAPGLAWLPAEEPAQVAAVVELPVGLAGALAAEVLVQRLAAQGAQVELHHPAGKLVLLFAQSGQATVARQDEVLRGLWETARLLTPEDTAKAWDTLSQRLLGSAAQAAARQALSVFFPALGTNLWVKPEEAEIRQVIAELPDYRMLPRFGVGPGQGPATGEKKKP